MKLRVTGKRLCVGVVMFGRDTRRYRQGSKLHRRRVRAFEMLRSWPRGKQIKGRSDLRGSSLSALKLADVGFTDAHCTCTLRVTE